MRGFIKSRLACCGLLVAALSLILLTGCSGVSSGGSGSQSSSAASLGVSPATLSFGNVDVGKGSSLTATLTASNGDVTVSSANVSGAGYKVTGMTFPLTIAAGKSANFTVTFTPSAAGTSDGSVTFMSDASDPALGQSLDGDGSVPGQPGSGHSVALSWTPSTSSVMGYNVYRGTQPGGPYFRINSSLAPSTSYTDDTVASGTTYYYVATSVDSNDVESIFSDQTVAQVPSP